MQSPGYTDFDESISNNRKMKGVVSGLAQMLYIAKQNSTLGTTFHFVTSGKKKNCLLE